MKLKRPFTTDNTNGYTQEQLEKMNAEVEAELTAESVNLLDSNYDELEKTAKERVFDRWC